MTGLVFRFGAAPQGFSFGKRVLGHFRLIFFYYINYNYVGRTYNFLLIKIKDMSLDEIILGYNNPI